MMTLTKIEKVFKALTPGKELTAEQLTRKTGAGNVTAIIAKLREEGHSIHTNPRRDKQGYRYYAYRMSA